MNAVEIEEAVSALAGEAFDAAEFPFAFLRAFGNKETTIKRLRTGDSNKSDLGGVLQTKDIHIKVCAASKTAATLAALKASPATVRRRRGEDDISVSRSFAPANSQLRCEGLGCRG